MNTIFKKGFRLWSRVRTVIAYRRSIRIFVKTFRPVLKITNKRIMRYVSVVTIFTMVFGLVFWSTDLNYASADMISMTSSKDSYVDQAHTSDNHGNDAELKVKSKNNSDNRRTYVAFDISTLPSNAVVQSATMSLWMKTNSSQDRTYGVYRVTADWTEGTITWSNKSATVSTATDTTSTGTSNNVFISWDVTSDVQAFKAGTYSNYGWMVRDETENNSSSQEKKFKSKEDNTSAQRPKLEIVYDVIEPMGSISGHKFNDLDGDGVWDEGEPGLANWTITLSNGDEITTDENGYYTFNELEDDEYTICEVMPESEDQWTQTKPSHGMECPGNTNGYSVEISHGNEVTNHNFGNVQYGSITVIKETNPSGYQDEFTFTVTSQENQELSGGQSHTYENLLAGSYTVQEVVPDGWSLSNIDCVYDEESVGETIENGKVVSLGSGDDVVCTFTNTKLGAITVWKYANPSGGSFDFDLQGPTPGETAIFTGEEGGVYVFENLEPGSYGLSETVPEGWTSDGGICDEDGSPSSIELSAGGNVSCIFNNTEYGTISGRKFEDLNANGEDDEDPGLEEWLVTINKVVNEEEEGWSSDTETDEDGNYIFTNLLPGTYRVCEYLENSWSQSMPSQGADCGENGFGYEITITAGEDVMGNDFGNYLEGLISGRKFNDLDGDGEYDDEPGLEGWTIELYDADGEVLLSSDVTDESGNYQFTDLKPGTYVVKEVAQDGWAQKLPADPNYYTISLSSEGEVTGYHFGNFKKPVITVYKYNDLDGDGILDLGEENSELPLQNWPIALGRILPLQGENQQIPIEIVAMSLTGIDGSAHFMVDQPGNYKVFEEKNTGWQATNPTPSIDSFFDITYDLDSIALGDPDFDLLRIGDPDFDLLRSSFFDIFVEVSGQNINSDNQDKPLRFLNHFIPTPTPTPTPETTPTPTPTPTPENNGGGGGGGGSGAGVIIDGPGSDNGGTVAGATITSTPTPTPTSLSTSSGQATPTPTTSGSSFSGGGSSSSGVGEPSPTSEVTGEIPTPTPSETSAPSEPSEPGGSNLFAEFLSSLPDHWLWLLPLFVLIALFLLWLASRKKD